MSTSSQNRELTSVSVRPMGEPDLAEARRIFLPIPKGHWLRKQAVRWQGRILRRTGEVLRSSDL